MPSYYPGGGVMLGTEAGTIYAELSVQDLLRWEQADAHLIQEVERELLKRGVDQRKLRYRIIDEVRASRADGMIADLEKQYRG
jgi:hypothetical protein